MPGYTPDINRIKNLRTTQGIGLFEARRICLRMSIEEHIEQLRSHGNLTDTEFELLLMIETLLELIHRAQ